MEESLNPKEEKIIWQEVEMNLNNARNELIEISEMLNDALFSMETSKKTSVEIKTHEILTKLRK